MVETQKQVKTTELIGAWEARQIKTVEQMERLKNVLDDVLAVSGRDGRKALAEKMRELITSERKDVLSIFEDNIDELDRLTEKGKSLLVGNDVLKKNPAIALVETAAGKEEADYMFMVMLYALESVFSNPAYSEEDKKIAQVVASDICNGVVLHVYENEIRKLRRSGILRRPLDGKERERKQEEIRNILRRADA